MDALDIVSSGNCKIFFFSYLALENEISSWNMEQPASPTKWNKTSLLPQNGQFGSVFTTKYLRLSVG